MNDISTTQIDAASGNRVFEDRMRQLRARFVERSRTDLVQIRELRRRMAAGDSRRDLLRIVHALSGAAGIFGHDEISAVAFRVELELRRSEGTPGAVDTGLDDLEALLTALLV